MTRFVTERQVEYGRALGLDLHGVTFRVAGAMIADRLEERALERIEELGLKPGDSVSYGGRVDRYRGRILLVSSIGRNGQVNFRGGGYAFPHNITKVSP